MASEITLSASIAVSKAPINLQKNFSGSLDMAGDDYDQATQDISESAWDALDLGQVTAPPGVVYIKNLDDTNFVRLANANDDSLIFGKIRPGGFAIFQPTSSTVFLKADTAIVKIEKVLVEL